MASWVTVDQYGEPGEQVPNDVISPLALLGGDIDPDQLRRLLIVQLHAQGVTVDELAAVFHCSRRTVYYEIRRVEPRVGRRVLASA